LKRSIHKCSLSIESDYDLSGHCLVKTVTLL
jgi:hypothetical protein